MATVTSQLTRIHDLEGTLTVVSIGGGAGAAANTDIFLQGTQSLGRRQSNVTVGGFLIDDGASGINISAADIHVGAWFWVTHYGSLTDVRLRMASNSGTANYDEHQLPLTEFPSLGGWVRVWADVSRTPDFTGGTGLDETAVRYYGPTISLPTVGGNAANLILDAVDHTTGGLLLTGTSGVWTDFTTADSNTTNRYGVVALQSGVFFCGARLTLGSSSSLVFSDSGFTLVFPQQALVNDTFMGVTADLQHASTSITFANGTLRSAGTKRGDFVVTGTSGTLTATVCLFSALRLVTLNTKCTITNCVFTSTGQVTAAGADLEGSSFSGYEGTANTSLLVWDVNTDPDGYLDNTAFTKGTAATHAIEFGTTSPTSLTLRGIDFSGYNASNSQNDSTLHIKRTSGTVTVNLVGCSGNISYQSAGATVSLVSDPVSLVITVKNVNTSAVVQGAYVLALAASGGSLPADVTVTITRSGSTATVTHTSHGLATGNKVRIKNATQPEYNGIYTITNTGTNEYTYTVSGSPATPATGTIKSSLVIIDGLTNASGQVSDTRSYSSDQPFSGDVRKGTAAPVFEASPVTGTIDSLAGASATVQLIPDT